MHNKVKNQTQADINRLMTIGQSVSDMITISGSTVDIHYLIAKIACHWINNDGDLTDLLTHEDIATLGLINETLHDCHLATLPIWTPDTVQ